MKSESEKGACKALLARLMFDNIPQYLLALLFFYSPPPSRPIHPPTPTQIDIEIIAIVNALLNKTHGGSAGANFSKQRAPPE